MYFTISFDGAIALLSPDLFIMMVDCLFVRQRGFRSCSTNALNTLVISLIALVCSGAENFRMVDIEINA